MKKRVLKVSNALLSGVLTLLGFGAAGCHTETLDEYGSPHADYRVVGTVTDEAGNPLEHVKVKVMRQYDGEHVQGIDSAYTDRSGRYETGEFDDFGLDAGGRVAFIDEGADGAFANDTVDVKDLPRTQYRKNDGWYSGAFEVTANAALKSKGK